MQGYSVQVGTHPHSNTLILIAVQYLHPRNNIVFKTLTSQELPHPFSVRAKSSARTSHYNLSGITWVVCHYTMSISQVLIPEPQNHVSSPSRATMENSWANTERISALSPCWAGRTTTLAQESHLVFLPFPAMVHLSGSHHHSVVGRWCWHFT